MSAGSRRDGTNSVRMVLVAGAYLMAWRTWTRTSDTSLVRRILPVARRRWMGPDEHLTSDDNGPAWLGVALCLWLLARRIPVTVATLGGFGGCDGAGSRGSAARLGRRARDPPLWGGKSSPGGQRTTPRHPGPSGRMPGRPRPRPAPARRPAGAAPPSAARGRLPGRSRPVAAPGSAPPGRSAGGPVSASRTRRCRAGAEAAEGTRLGPAWRPAHR